jgi:pyruvate dehydrogenase E2 component (dihydrolipoamide acetyltransferase)
LAEYGDNFGFDEQAGGLVPVTNIQKIIAARMLESKRTMPAFYLTIHADLTDMTRLRRELGRSLGAKIGSNDFIMRAMAIAVEKFPLFAGQLKGDVIEIASTVNVGLAVAAPQGLVVPVIKDAHKKSLVKIAEESKILTNKARSNKLSLADLTGCCITLSNLGVYNIESFVAVAPPGECAIVAIGRAVETSLPKDGSVYERKMMALTLAADHRIVNGTYAAQFLECIKGLLENPQELIK